MTTNHKDDGGPAFPTGDYYADEDTFVSAMHGMSLRDYFAAKALQALISKTPLTTSGELHERLPEACAVGAYDYADAMLKARGEA